MRAPWFARHRTRSGDVGRPEMFAYAWMVWPLLIGQGPLVLLVPLYAQQLGLPLATVGLILTLGRIYDAALDPAVAYLSDRTPKRFGRRRSWVVAGSIGFLAACWYLYVPPAGRGIAGCALAVFLFFTTWTGAFTPYLAQGGEIATDYRQRTTINLIQSALMIVGGILMSVLPYLLTDPQTHALRLGFVGWFETLPLLSRLHGFIAFLRLPAMPVAQNYANIVMVSVWLMTIVAPFVTLAYVVLVRDGSEKAGGAHASFSAALRNPVFIRFCLGYMLMMAGYMGRIGLFPFIVTYTVSGGVSFLFLAMVGSLCSIAVTPLWAKVFQRFERGTCLALAGRIEACGLLLLAFAPSGAGWAVAAVFIMALPGQTLIMAPYLVASDCADYSEWKTGSESRGVHVSIISLVIKSGAIVSALTIVVAGLLGFDPRQAVGPQEVLTIKVIGLVIPAMLLIAGSFIVRDFAITRRRQAAIRSRIDRRAE